MIKSVLSNLIKNALRYTPFGKSVTITGATTSRHVVVVVADTGVGIDPTEKDKIFRNYSGLILSVD